MSPAAHTALAQQLIALQQYSTIMQYVGVQHPAWLHSIAQLALKNNLCSSSRRNFQSYMEVQHIKH